MVTVGFNDVWKSKYVDKLFLVLFVIQARKLTRRAPLNGLFPVRIKAAKTVLNSEASISQTVSTV